MKNLIRNAVPLLFLAPALILAGCYTQFGGVKGEDTPDEQSYNNDEYVDSTGGQYAYDDYARYPYGMRYYYPPYNDPWFYGARPIYGYGYGYTPYDAMWWDYSPYFYGGYYAPYHSPYYGYAYGGAYYGHGTEPGNIGTRRTIGNIRAAGATRGMESGYMPVGRGSGSSMTLPSGASRRPTTTVATPKTSTARPAGTGGAVSRGANGRSGSGSGASTRSSTPQSRPSSGGSRGGSTRGGSGHSSYTPPPSPPPSSSGGTTSGGSGDRGSSSSGGSSSGGSRSGGSRR